jgi:ubiquinone/menaquinone biosynthesis C-methylase UbiE
VSAVSERPSERYYRDTAKYYEPFANRLDEPFFKKMAERYGSPILELASGTGRISIILAEENHTVVGIELSPEMLEIAQEKLQNLPETVQSRVTFHHGDITDFNLGQKFSMIIIPSAFKFLLTSDDQLACLKCTRDHLQEDGVFILDLYPGEIFEEDGAYTTYPSEIDGTMVTKSYKFYNDLDTQLRRTEVIVEITHPRGDVERIETESMTAIITAQEGDRLLKLASLQVVEEYGGWDFSPFKLGSWRRILVLRKER